jgi:signal peptidase I
LKPQEYRRALLQRRGDEVSLPGPPLIELLRAVLDKGVPFRFQARGFSMSPFIKDGDLITVAPLKGASPGLVDVIAFTHAGTSRLVIHRVVGKRADSYLVKGDNTLDVDGFIPEANILGCVKKVERNGKKIILGLGLERFLIAFLTCRRLLFPVLRPVWILIRPLVKLLWGVKKGTGYFLSIEELIDAKDYKRIR